MKPHPVLVVGAGTWGTALALLLCHNGHHVTLTGRNPAALRKMRETRCNTRYLPGVKLPVELEILPPSKLPHPSDQALVLAVPCQALRAALQEYRTPATEAQAICLTCKGIEQQSLKFPHEITQHCLPGVPTALLSGPTFATETACWLPTAATLAATHKGCRDFFSKLFHNENFRIYPSQDMMGVALGGAMKNVIAIAAGASDGLGFGHNARAALIARGLAEITRLGEALAATRESFYGLSGLGDLVLTCTGNESRNYRFGRLLGEGLDPGVARQRIATTIEGMHTAASCASLAQKHKVDMPITVSVTKLLTGEGSVRMIVRGLLARKPGREFY